MGSVVVLVRRTLVAVGLVGWVVGGAVVGTPIGGLASIGEDESASPVMEGMNVPVDAPPALAAAGSGRATGERAIVRRATPIEASAESRLAVEDASSEAATGDGDACAVREAAAAPGALPTGAHPPAAGEPATGAPVAEAVASSVAFDVELAHADATRTATSDAVPLSHALAIGSAVVEAHPDLAHSTVAIDGRCVFVRLPSGSRAISISAAEAALDRVATIDGPVATLLIEDLAPTGAADGAVLALEFDAPRSHRVSASGGRARIACGGLDLWVGQEGFGYMPVFDLVRDGLQASASWEPHDGIDAVRVDVAREWSFDRASADGDDLDVEVAQDAPFAPPELVAPLTDRVATRTQGTTIVPAVVGAVTETDCGGRRVRVTVLRVDASAPIRRGWRRMDVRLAPSGYDPPDVETLECIVDRPSAAGGPVAGSVDLEGASPVDAALAPSSARDADVGDPSDATVREFAGLARTLTAPLVVHASACEPDPARTERSFDLRVVVAGDDLTWDPIDVPRPWGTDALRRNEPIVIRSLRRPSVTSVVVPLRVRIGPGGEVRRALTIDRGHGPEQWVLTVLRRAPHDR